MALTIISLMKQVPLPSEMRMGDDGLMDRTKAKSIINIDCGYALEAGLQMKVDNPDAKLIVCSMGPPSFDVSLKKAISMGYDEAYLLSDRRLGGSDTYATGLAISTMLKHLGFGKGLNEDFIIVAGRQTSDGDTAHVPSQVAENMGIPQATFIEVAKLTDRHIEAKRIIEGGYQMMRLPLPCTLSFTPTGISPRRVSLSGAVKARNVNVTVFNIDDINLSDEKIGLSGSPTIVAKVANIVSERAPIKMCEGHNEAELVSSLIENMKSGKNTIEVKEKKTAKEKKRPEGFKEVDFRNGASGILTWAEVVNGKISRPSLELLTPARNLASDLGDNTKVMTLLIGKDISELAKELIAHGADEVITVEDEKLEEYRILPFSSIFAQVIKEKNPEIALFAATTAGRELAPRIGVKTQGGVTADCTALEIGEHYDRKNKIIYSPILESRRPTYGESKLATILGFVCPQISTARAGTFEVPTPDASRKGSVLEFVPLLTDDDFVTEIIETVRGEGGLQNLFEADVIIAGGRGTVGDDMQLIKDLAAALTAKGINAEWAVSRPVVDEGLAEYARQVGQTGKTVRPKVYIAIGISGAVQHIAGMKEAETIVAINHHPKETIFANADFGILGEYEDLLPELIEKVNSGFTFGLEVK
ncbi:electron transfer flavoprotein, alpha subunit [Sulfurimonas gotlandica GD1]|uniref:Electron transfer flavoprotein, alpha subunit n=1 Tax=Sulfurimonas gotlandica (strain DSM 19862 / JCM 16533 / GD1) TaxID=929558 RepID=B6BK80_SULGG|nr:FAD-binding protein [Sulfurimonas gotlandica]EDZ62664.1 electron transfer flavoprotein, alpha subunit [Sulfurimonas gotlandica GD1]EHP31174.1 electron transfer flavoprotein, alpha subunit [Sulfurimonas gotlandica GD1]